jgi:multiple sugar transport system permease protein
VADAPAPAAHADPHAADAARLRAARARRRLAAGVQNALLLLTLAIILFPIGWIVMTAFKLPRDVYDVTVVFPPTLQNFVIAFQAPWNLGGKLVNSLVVSLVTVAIAVPVATLAAYAFSRFDFMLKRGMFLAILGTQFVPAVVIILPLYLLFRDLGILDTRTALVVINLAIVTPFAVWMIKGYLDAIPGESEEAALVDGASRIRVIFDIVVPMALPGMITAAVFCFILTWNEFIFALILTRENAVTLPVGLISFRTERGDWWELIAASGIIITVPMFLLALVIQRHFVKGMTMGAVR